MPAQVRVSVVGFTDDPGVEWPEGWPIPREGESVELGLGSLVVVRTVAWYPVGEDGDSEPFVYVVLGPPRPRY